MTRTPLKSTVNTDTNAVFLPNPSLELFLQTGNTSVKHKNPKIQKPKNPKTQKPKNLKLFTSTESCSKKKGFLEFGIFRFLEFWILGFFGFVGFWILGFSQSGSLDPCISGRQDLYFRVL